MSFGTSVIWAPGDVSPGHIIFAPLSTKRIAPLSTCCIGRKNGSTKKSSNWQGDVKRFYIFTFVQ